MSLASKVCLQPLAPCIVYCCILLLWIFKSYTVEISPFTTLWTYFPFGIASSKLDKKTKKKSPARHNEYEVDQWLVLYEHNSGVYRNSKCAHNLPTMPCLMQGCTCEHTFIVGFLLQKRFVTETLTPSFKLTLPLALSSSVSLAVFQTTLSPALPPHSSFCLL